MSADLEAKSVVDRREKRRMCGERVADPYGPLGLGGPLFQRHQSYQDAQQVVAAARSERRILTKWVRWRRLTAKIRQ